jgi:hypothetical protein
VKSTSKKVSSKKPEPKVSVAPKKAPTTKASTKECVANHAPLKQLVHPPTVNPSPVEEISDLLDTLSMKACVELTRRLLTAIPSFPSGPARSGAILKTIILFAAEFGSTA